MKTSIIYVVEKTAHTDFHNIALDIGHKLKVETVHNLYEQYFLIDDLIAGKEKNIWKESDRIILFFPLYLYGVPYLLQKYIEQLEKCFKQGVEPVEGKRKEILVVSWVHGSPSDYTIDGKYHTTIHYLLKPIQTWVESAKMKYLVPKIIYNYNYNEKQNEEIKTIAAMCVVEKLPYIDFIEETVNNVTKYKERIITE